MRTIRCAGVSAGALVLALVCGSGAVAAVDPDFRDDGRKGTAWICHRTASTSRPYVLLRVPKNSREYASHLVHRHYSNGHGYRDLIDGVDGRVRSLRDCPEWWSTELDWPYGEDVSRHRKETRFHQNRQKQKQKQGQVQTVDIYLKKYKQQGRKGRKHGAFKTYRPRAVSPAHRPTRPGQVAPRGVRPKGIVGPKGNVR